MTTALIPFAPKVPAEWNVYAGRSMFGSVVVRMPNGYGASILRDPYRSAPELGVIKFFGPGDFEWHLTYDTPITNDVELFYSEAEVMQLLQQIAALPQEIK
jgi:Mg-chelatase subunit ChlD